jgi:hypothetical protein
MKKNIVFIKSLVFCNLFNAFYRKKLLANAIKGPLASLRAASGAGLQGVPAVVMGLHLGFIGWIVLTLP